MRFWQEKDIFRESMDRRRGNPSFVFYEGPPTANGRPGIHHILARVFKDIIPRYKTMKGFHVLRRAGWDTHGLPVELEVEKELNLSSKDQIENYGVDKFNAKCRDSVFRYLKDWKELTARIGFWIDMDDPYITLDNRYIETGWWIIKNFWDRGLIYQGHRVTPHCPRCGTSLSSHEVSLGYKDDTPDPSVYIKFRIKDFSAGTPAALRDLLSSHEPAYLLAWTTTPWTLPGNVAVAVSPTTTYAVVEISNEAGKEKLILGEALLPKVIKEEYRLLGTFPGSQLLGLKYEPLFDPREYDVPLKKFANKEVIPSHIAGTLLYPVIGGDFVSLEEGTGIVHIAPAFGEVDYEAGKREGLHFVQQVDNRGLITGKYRFAGKFVKNADPLIEKDLKERGLLYHRETIRHTYPFCWRCSTPLLYYAKASWYIRTTAVKEKLNAGNEEINWYPDHIKHGRFGDWLRNNVDWALSRERYWGTPLPVWRCPACKKHQCVGSVAEIKEKVHSEAMEARGLNIEENLKDLHRPYIDEVLLRCPGCGGPMKREPEVMDCWFDSGAMPVAQWHYPFENQEQFKANFPADYICEAVDQTRGWFYTLHAISTLLFEKPCYKNVLCLGLILDAKGEKMSKARGNVVDPWSVLKKQGADALRWYLLTATQPGNVRRFSVDQVQEIVKGFLLTLWNTYSFFVTYANIDKYEPKRFGHEEPTEWDKVHVVSILDHEKVKLSELDRWIISELNLLVQEVDKNLSEFNTTQAGRAIEDFVEYLSNWYIRRSRRRFWKSENDSDKLAAYDTLYTCLTTLSHVMAPFMPFLAEEMYQNLVLSVDSSAPPSVHLRDFPAAEPGKIDMELSSQIRLVMKMASLGRAARSKANIKVRQPISRALVRVRDDKERRSLERLSAPLLEELNIKGLEFISDKSTVMDIRVSADMSLLGPKYGKKAGEIASLLKSMDALQVAAAKSSGKPINVESYELLPEEIKVEARGKEGYSAAEDGEYVVAVSTELTAELLQEGAAREVVHRLQTMRKTAGFDIADYIILYYDGDDYIQSLMESQAGYIKGETLSRRMVKGPPDADAYQESLRLDGHDVVLGVRKA